MFCVCHIHVCPVYQCLSVWTKKDIFPLHDLHEFLHELVLFFVFVSLKLGSGNDTFFIFLIRPFPQMSFFHFQISSFTIIASYWHGQRALTNSFIYKFMSNKNDAVVFCVTSPKIDTKNINTKSIFPIHTWSLISFTCKRNVCRYLLSK